MGYIGYDGKEYDTYLEMVGADEKYKNMKKQTELLNEQNRLMEEQNYRIQRESEMNRLLEEEKIINDKLIAEEKIEHDKEMRLLSLFDGVGLNKTFYDEFISYLFKDDILNLIDINEKNNNKISDIKNNIMLINKYLDGKEEFDKVSKFIYEDISKDELIRDKNLFEEYLKNHNRTYQNTIISKLNLDDTDEFSELNSKVEKNTETGTKFAIGAFISLFVGLMFSDSDFIPTLAIVSMFICVIVGLYYFLNGNNRKASKMLDSLVKESLDNINKQIMEYEDSDYIKNKLNKQVDNFNGQIKNIELENKNYDKKLDDVKVKWNDFVKFRKSHYNSKIESLFIDAGLEKQINSLGLDYCRITSDNKKKNGTIEDYITYFNKLK